MRQRLQALNALNRADSVLTATERDEAQALVNYFDRHGTPNDQLLAHYLLGRCYADMREAPMALHCYQEAITRADTLSPDCDYTELMAVYGQMADLYHLQNLPMDEIDASEKYQHYALLTNDTLKFIRNIQLMVKPYYLLGDTEKVLEVMDTAQKLYLKYGYKKEAAGVYATPIFIMTQRGQLTEARRMIHEFEHKSGLFDGNGNICKGREAYYYTRGLFCLAVNELDSARNIYAPFTTSAIRSRGLPWASSGVPPQKKCRLHFKVLPTL
jgi:tetratricopeptide (TPR) repeat protein